MSSKEYFRTDSSSAVHDDPDGEWLSLSDDGCALTLYPYVGKAWEIGKQIQALYYPENRPYMNGYCWSSMVKYYLRSIDSSRLLYDIEILPEEHECVFRTQKSNTGSVRQLSEILRKDITLLPNWIKKSQFDEWDNW